MAAIRHLEFFVRMCGTTREVSVVAFITLNTKFGSNSFDNIEV